MNNQNHIGWIGLGKMGIPMASSLIKAGYKVSVYNRNQAKANTLLDEGALLANSPAELIQNTSIVVLMVSDDAAINEIFNSEKGLFTASITDKIIINMSTVSPKISKEMAGVCAQKGGWYIDAPVSGSVKQATEGSLVIMAGGNKEAFEKAKPVFNHLGKLSLWLGENGAGNSAKLAINSLLALHAQGLAEAVLFAQSKGIKTEDLLELINNSALGNVFMKIKGEAILQDNYSPAFALKHIVKDLGLAKDEGIQSPLVNTAFETFSSAGEELGEEDIISVIKQIK